MKIALQLAITASLMVALAGLVARRRLGLCWSFVPYALAIIICGNLATLWPARFFTPEFWLFKQALYDLCKLAIALELAWRVLRAFPGAERTARRWVAVLLVGSTTVAAMGPPRAYDSIAEWQLGALVGIVWLFTLTALVVVWYRLPVHVWHRALLAGFSGYLLVFGAALQAFRSNGWTIAWWVGLADGGAYLVVAWMWGLAAWRREPLPEGTSETVARRLGLAAL